MSLELLYQEKRGARDAMAPHMDKLRELASECNVCVEFGIRKASSSTALLAGCTGAVYSYDIEILPKHKVYIERLHHAVGDRWHIRLENSVTAAVPECDLLLHDSLHNHWQVSLELAMHGHKVRRYLAFHDTHTHAKHGQRPSDWTPDSRIRGIRHAIEKYAKGNGWKIVHDVKHSHGLMVLQRQK